mgnify:CR=1 FL=1
MFAKMINMAHTPEEVKQELKENCITPGVRPSVPTYPYGLCISLDEDSIEKLGLDKRMPGIGEIMPLVCSTRVTSVSQNESEREDGSKHSCSRIELQITDMGLPLTDMAEMQVVKSEQRRKRFYGAGEPDGDEG